MPAADEKDPHEESEADAKGALHGAFELEKRSQGTVGLHATTGLLRVGRNFGIAGCDTVHQ
jgi:hypothetical protein